MRESVRVLEGLSELGLRRVKKPDPLVFEVYAGEWASVYPLAKGLKRSTAQSWFWPDVSAAV